MFKLNIKNFIIFCFVWGSIGFVLGTEILMGPSRWIIDIARNNPDMAYIEGPAIRTLILLLVSCSLPVALFLTRSLLVTRRKHVRIGIALILTVSMLSTLYMWFNPKKFGNEAAPSAGSSERFTVGSYPDLAKLKELKKEGYTAVISLLHPAVVPFETSLIGQEKGNAEKAKIEFIHLPMLPWISENKGSLSKLREIAASPEGKYYLHCYLGKDRVSVALKTIADVDPSVAGELGTRARKLSARRTLERGQVQMVAKDIYLTPYLTGEEYFNYIIGANVTNVVCLRSAEEGETSQTITDSSEILKAYNIIQTDCPISLDPYDSASIRKAVNTVKAMTGPVVIFDFRCPSFRTEAFVQAYNDDRPALPPSLLKSELQVGKVDHVAPNVIIGPRPDNLKKFTELENIGVKKYIYVGYPDDPEAVRDKELSAAARFDWQLLAPSTENLLSALKSDGPWYVYGSLSPDTIEKLKADLGPAYTEPSDHVAILEAENAEAPTKHRFHAKLQAVRNTNSPSTFNPLKIALNFATESAPSPRMLILFSPFCLLYAYVCASFAGWLRVDKNVRTSYTRKVFHFLIFSMACFVQLKSRIQGTVLYGTIVCSCVIYAIFRGKDFPFYEAMARPTDAPHRSLYIFIPMVTTALGGVLANIFFQPAAIIGYLACGWGDAIGEPAGAKWGKHKYKVHSLFGVPATRSIEGSAAVMIASFLAALLGLLLMGAPLGLAATAALICAIAVVFTEALSTHGLDNLTVQVVASAVVYFLLRFTA